MIDTHAAARRCDHRGLVPVRVGPYTIHAGALYRMTPQDFAGYDVLVPLSVDAPIPFEFGARYRILAAYIRTGGRCSTTSSPNSPAGPGCACSAWRATAAPVACSDR
jgi:hypothetical protein